MSDAPVGFIGLGNMGGPMSANLVAAGRSLLVHDAAGTQSRAPAGAAVAPDNASVARGADPVVLSLPDGAVVRAVADELAAVADARVRTVIDTSTIGITAARDAHARLAAAGIEYLDAPVSGGVSGARNATIAVMFAGPKAAFERYAPLLEGMARHVFHVGVEPGLGQAMKVLNNFLSGTAMAATSEAVAFGVRQGLDMATIVEVLNVSSGRNTATSDKFPNRILTETWDAGFTSRLMEKDLRLFDEAVEAIGGHRVIGPRVRAAWRQLEAAEPNADITRIYPFLRDGGFREEDD